MILEINKQYRTRGGKSVFIVRDDGDEVQPFRADNGLWYTADGRRLGSTGADPDDILGELALHDLARLRDTINRVWAQTYGPGDDRTEIEVLERRVVALADDRNAWKFNVDALEKERNRA